MIPENPMQTPPEPVPVEPPLGSKRPRASGVGAREDGADRTPGGLLPVVSHVLSRELQYYFDKVTGLIRGAGAVGASDENEEMLETALRSLSTDVGLHNLMRCYASITEEATQNLRDLPRLRVLIQMTRALISNPDINVELYLHQLMPSVVTCMVAKRLCKNVEEDHWSAARRPCEHGRLHLRQVRRGVPEHSAQTHADAVARAFGHEAALDALRRD